MPPSSTRQLGSITRIYKNAANKVLAIDDISINVSKDQSVQRRFISYIDSVDVQRTLIHLSANGDRTIALIQMIGNYSSITEDSGNFFVVKWESETTDSNDLEISLEKYVSAIGDTL